MKDLKPHGTTSLHDIIPTLSTTPTPRITLVDHRPALSKLRRQDDHARIVRSSLVRQELLVHLLRIRQATAAHRIAHGRAVAAAVELLAHGHDALAQFIFVDELEVGRDAGQDMVVDVSRQRHGGSLDLGQFAHKGPVQLLFDLGGRSVC